MMKLPLGSPTVTPGAAPDQADRFPRASIRFQHARGCAVGLARVVRHVEHAPLVLGALTELPSGWPVCRTDAIVMRQRSVMS